MSGWSLYATLGECVWTIACVGCIVKLRNNRGVTATTSTKLNDARLLGITAGITGFAPWRRRYADSWNEEELTRTEVWMDCSLFKHGINILWRISGVVHLCLDFQRIPPSASSDNNWLAHIQSAVHLAGSLVCALVVDGLRCREAG